MSRFYTFSYNVAKENWEEGGITKVPSVVVASEDLTLLFRCLRWTTY